MHLVIYIYVCVRVYAAGVKGRTRGYIAVTSRGVHRGSVYLANNGRDVRDESDTRRTVCSGHQFRDIQIHDVLQSNTIHHVDFTLQRE